MKDDNAEPNAEENIIFGVNPVREALRADLPIDRAYVHNPAAAARELAGKLKARGVPVLEVGEHKLLSLCPQEHKKPNHQGIVCRIAATEYVDLEEMMRLAMQTGEQPFFVLLDGITDPQNLGGIVRSAEAMGVHGVIIPKRRAAGMTAAAFRASSGAAAHIPICRVTNLAAAMDELKANGLWVLGAQSGAPDARKQNLSGGVVLCIGSEGAGLSRLTRDKCDALVGIPLAGKTASLNASCAASILIYEIQGQRRAGDGRNLAD